MKGDWINYCSFYCLRNAYKKNEAMTRISSKWKAKHNQLLVSTTIHTARSVGHNCRNLQKFFKQVSTISFGRGIQFTATTASEGETTKLFSKKSMQLPGEFLMTRKKQHCNGSVHYQRLGRSNKFWVAVVSITINMNGEKLQKASDTTA